MRQSFLSKVVYKRVGTGRGRVLVGPGSGLDTSVVKVGTGKVLLSTTDPLSLIPRLGSRLSAWLSVHLIASDVATSGIGPQYATLDFNLPPQMTDSVFESYFDAIGKECRNLGISIIGGHTGRYEGCNYSIIGGGVMMALCPLNRYLTSAMAMGGDDLIMTKGVAIETTAVLARSFPKKVNTALGSRLFERAWAYPWRVSTVRDALTASSIGVRTNGVTAMHDATEGGAIAALLELANASRLGLRVDLQSIEISEETSEICKLFHIDPLTSLSEGTLIIAARPFATSRILKKLTSIGLTASVVGKLVSKDKRHWGISGQTNRPLRYPSKDPYWDAYSRAIARGWN